MTTKELTIEVRTKALLEAVERVLPFTMRRSSYPGYSTVQFALLTDTPEGRKLMVTGMNDGAMGTTVVEGARAVQSWGSGEAPPAFGVEARRLRNLLAATSEESMKMVIEATGLPDNYAFKTTVAAGYEATLLWSESIPKAVAPTTERTGYGSLPAGLVSSVIHATAREDSRPILTSVTLQKNANGGTEAVAADGFRLAVQSLGQSLAPPDGGLHIPGAVMRYIAAQAGDFQAIVAGYEHGIVHFSLPNVEVYVKAVQGTYPNYNQLIPEGATWKVVASAVGFKKLVRLAGLVSRESSGIIRLTAEGGTLRVQAQAEFLATFDAGLLAEVEGEPKVAVNHEYLEEALTLIAKRAEHVTITGTTPSSPVMFEVPGYREVIMPMFVQW